MTDVRFVLFFIWMMCLWLVVCGQHPPLSPCPKVFVYENDGMQWYGTIKVQSPNYGSVMKLQVSLSLGAKLPTNYTGSLELVGERGRILLNILRGLPITYKVNFPLLTPIPRVTKITFNGQLVCEGPPETMSKVVTDIKLNHVLQTGDGVPNNTSQQKPMNQDSVPNPENFAQPHPHKPSKGQGNKPEYASSINDESQLSNELISDIYGETLPEKNKDNIYPQKKPTQDNSNGFGFPEYALSTENYVPIRPQPPLIKPTQRPTQNANNHGTRPQNQNGNLSKPQKQNQPQVSDFIPGSQNPGSQGRPQHVVTGIFDSYHDSITGTSNVLPNPDLLSNKPITLPPNKVVQNGDPQTMYNYHLSQDKNVTKTEVFHGTPDNSNLPYNYYYHQVNKSETVVNRFSYQWSNPPHPVPIGQVNPQNTQPMWKESQADPQLNTEMTADDMGARTSTHQRRVDTARYP